jgi:hypothetical protein
MFFLFFLFFSFFFCSRGQQGSQGHSRGSMQIRWVFGPSAGLSHVCNCVYFVVTAVNICILLTLKHCINVRLHKIAPHVSSVPRCSITQFTTIPPAHIVQLNRQI